jgi:hypothetical protein
MRTLEPVSFNYALSISGYRASNNRKNGEEIGKDKEGSGRGLMYGTISAFALRD